MRGQVRLTKVRSGHALKPVSSFSLTASKVSVTSDTNFISSYERSPKYRAMWSLHSYWAPRSFWLFLLSHLRRMAGFSLISHVQYGCWGPSHHVVETSGKQEKKLGMGQKGTASCLFPLWEAFLDVLTNSIHFHLIGRNLVTWGMFSGHFVDIGTQHYLEERRFWSKATSKDSLER